MYVVEYQWNEQVISISLTVVGVYLSIFSPLYSVQGTSVGYGIRFGGEYSTVDDDYCQLDPPTQSM